MVLTEWVENHVFDMDRQYNVFKLFFTIYNYIFWLPHAKSSRRFLSTFRSGPRPQWKWRLRAIVTTSETDYWHGPVNYKNLSDHDVENDLWELEQHLLRNLSLSCSLFALKKKPFLHRHFVSHVTDRWLRGAAASRRRWPGGGVRNDRNPIKLNENVWQCFTMLNTTFGL